MKRFDSASLSICAVVGLFSVVVACGEGGDDPASTGGSGNTAAGSTGAGAGGTTTGTGGTPAAGTGGTTTGTGGSSGSTTGGTGGTTQGGSSVCDGATRDLPEEEAFVDDFEDDVRFGGWYAFADDGNAEPHDISREATGALSTAMGVHVSATGITPPPEGGYGAGFGFNMIDPALEKCVDVSAFDGISFWAKGTSGADNKLTFQVVHPATAPVADGGDCTAQCYLHPKKAIDLTADWQQYTIAWADLAGTVDVTGPILGFNLITAGTEYDVWLDEVTLYKGTAPTGPVGTDEGAGGGGG